MLVSVYPTIDPEPHFSAQTYRGKVVLITGASRGVGAETALAYARAGAPVAILVRWKQRKFAPRLQAPKYSSSPRTFAARKLSTPPFERHSHALKKVDMVLANAGTATNLSEL